MPRPDVGEDIGILSRTTAEELGVFEQGFWLIDDEYAGRMVYDHGILEHVEVTEDPDQGVRCPPCWARLQKFLVVSGAGRARMVSSAVASCIHRELGEYTRPGTLGLDTVREVMVSRRRVVVAGPAHVRGAHASV